ncbi:hypothetical protein FACS1894101_2810 [Betaproteobacteria bacterium]|nr:hypothetical protein FACS1894101_2810 [Betaproteobacteria bacterium]
MVVALALDNNYAFAGGSGGGRVDICVFGAVFVVRPAFNLDLTSVLFTSASSDAAGVGKSAATAGGGYTPLATPAAARKITFLDKTISTPELTLISNALDFNYSVTPATSAPGASSAEKLVSGFLYNGTADVYAKYANTGTNPNGSFNARPASDGTGHELHIFSEEANDHLYSDFASESVDFTFTMNNGTVEDLTLTSNSAFALNNSSIALEASKTFDQVWSLANGSVLDAFSATAFTPSSLNVRGKDNTITGDLTTNGGALNFYLPGGIDNNDTLLTVTGNANIGGSAVNLALDGGNNLTTLAATNKITLLNAAGGLTTGYTSGTTSLTATVGTAFTYNFKLSDDGKNNLYATLDSKTSPLLPPPQ